MKSRRQNRNSATVDDLSGAGFCRGLFDYHHYHRLDLALRAIIIVEQCNRGGSVKKSSMLDALSSTDNAAVSTFSIDRASTWWRLKPSDDQREPIGREDPPPTTLVLGQRPQCARGRLPLCVTSISRVVH